MKKILISGAGGSLFPYLYEKMSKRFSIVLVDGDINVGLLYDKNIFYQVPMVADENFKNSMIDIIRKKKIDYYIPLIDEELLIAREIAEECNIIVIVPSNEFIGLTLNKYKLMQKLSELNISNIKTFLASDYNDQLKFPLFLKPFVGRGSRGIYKIENHKEYKAYFDLLGYEKNKIIVQPYLDGIEYTVGVVVNSLNHIISIVPKKIMIKEGVTKLAYTEKNKTIDVAMRKIVDELKPNGSFNAQLKLYNGVVSIFEINPRFSTTSILSCEAGVDEVSLSIDNYSKNIEEEINFEENVMLFRRWENIFLKRNQNV